LDLEGVTALFLIRVFLFDTSGWLGLSPFYIAVFFFLMSIVMAPVSIYLGVRREIAFIQLFYLLFSSFLLFYIAYNVVILWILDPGFRFEIYEIRETQIIVSIICLVFMLVRVSLIISGIMMMFHFRSGLKDKVYGKDGFFYKYWRPLLSLDSSKGNFLIENESPIDYESLN
jgi:uncharacterized membrane protein